MANGEWRMANGEWRMANKGSRRPEDCKALDASSLHSLLATRYSLSATRPNAAASLS